MSRKVAHTTTNAHPQALLLERETDPLIIVVFV